MKRGSLSTFLACVGAAGMVCTVIMAVKATPKALESMHNDSRINHNGDPYACTTREAIRSTYKYYLPSVCVGVSSLACILGGSFMNNRKNANIVSAYAITNKAYREYKEKVKELYGKEAHEKVIESVAAEQCRDVSLSACGLTDYITLDFDEDDADSKKLFYDSFSKRYFESSINKVLQAEYHLNRNFILGGCVPLSMFFNFLGLEETDCSSELVWEISDDYYWIDFSHRKIFLDDGVECYVIDMVFEPKLSDNIYL